MLQGRSIPLPLRDGRRDREARAQRIHPPGNLCHNHELRRCHPQGRPSRRVCSKGQRCHEPEEARCQSGGHTSKGKFSSPHGVGAWFMWSLTEKIEILGSGNTGQDTCCQTDACRKEGNQEHSVCQVSLGERKGQQAWRRIGCEAGNSKL